MKRVFWTILVFAVLGVSFVGWFFLSIRPLSSDKTEKRFLIQKGETATQIGTNLQKQGFIKSAIAFRIYSQISQSAKNIQPGQYDLSSNLSIHAIIDKFLKGPNEIWVTIPEGLRREEIAKKFIDGFGLSGTRRDDFYKDFLADSAAKEGFLFPDTYLFPKDAAVSIVVKTLRNNFQEKAGDISEKELVMASILERETITDEERPVVAGILFKRLDAGWPLQADATVQYARDSAKCKALSIDCKWWEPATHEDLSIDSPYNTYKFPGLPLAPICNPGLSSINAAKNPTKSDYWYYIHDKDGKIHYARTIEEQNANIAKYLD